MTTDTSETPDRADSIIEQFTHVPPNNRIDLDEIEERLRETRWDPPGKWTAADIRALLKIARAAEALYWFNRMVETGGPDLSDLDYSVQLEAAEAAEVVRQAFSSTNQEVEQ